MWLALLLTVAPSLPAVDEQPVPVVAEAEEQIARQDFADDVPHDDLGDESPASVPVPKQKHVVRGLRQRSQNRLQPLGDVCDLPAPERTVLEGPPSRTVEDVVEGTANVHPDRHRRQLQPRRAQVRGRRPGHAPELVNGRASGVRVDRGSRISPGALLREAEHERSSPVDLLLEDPDELILPLQGVPEARDGPVRVAAVALALGQLAPVPRALVRLFSEPRLQALDFGVERRLGAEYVPVCLQLV